MDARKDLYAFAMQGKEHSPANSDRASEKIDAFRTAVLREAADALDSGKSEFPTDVQSGSAWAIRTLRRMAEEKPEEAGE